MYLDIYFLQSNMMLCFKVINALIVSGFRLSRRREIGSLFTSEKKHVPLKLTEYRALTSNRNPTALLVIDVGDNVDDF